MIAESDSKPTRMHPSEVLRQHQEEILATIAAFEMRNPRVFGSVARGTDTVDSDLDIVVTVPSGSALRFFSLADALSLQLGVHVDVISDGAITDATRHILDEAVPL
jgi:predicted nucleotidyltransferase